MAYHRYHGVDTKIARIFNTFGPRMRINDGRVVPTFISQAMNTKPLTVFGDGSQTRSFCYVDDLIEGIYRLLMSEQHDPVNIGNPSEMSIMEFARLITELVGCEENIVMKPLPIDDPKIRQPNISLAKELLGWEPQTPLEEGLMKTIHFFKTKNLS